MIDEQHVFYGRLQYDKVGAVERLQELHSPRDIRTPSITSIILAYMRSRGDDDIANVIESVIARILNGSAPSDAMCALGDFVYFYTSDDDAEDESLGYLQRVAGIPATETTYIIGSKNGKAKSLDEVFDSIKRAQDRVDEAIRRLIPDFTCDNRSMCKLAGVLSKHFPNEPLSDWHKLPANELLGYIDAIVEETIPTSVDEPLDLTPLHRRILEVMVSHKTRVSYSELRSAWGNDGIEDATITKTLKRLRENLPRSQWGFVISEANYEVTWTKKGQTVP